MLRNVGLWQMAQLGLKSLLTLAINNFFSFFNECTSIIINLEILVSFFHELDPSLPYFLLLYVYNA